jgi:DNA repair protein SbcC/Rad50
MCPVCYRNSADLDDGSLSDHVQTKVRSLSGSAGRLLSLWRSRGQAQISVERLDGEIETLQARTIDPQKLASLERDAAAAATVAREVEAMKATLDEGGRLLARDIGARRAVTKAQSRNVALLAARETLRTFSVSIGAPELAEIEQVGDALARLQGHVMAEAARLGVRLTNRRQPGNRKRSVNRRRLPGLRAYHERFIEPKRNAKR